MAVNTGTKPSRPRLDGIVIKTALLGPPTTIGILLETDNCLYLILKPLPEIANFSSKYFILSKFYTDELY